jgi:hypothetical protein
MAKADARLGLYTSLDAARAHVEKQRRTRAIAKVLEQQLRASTDPAGARIALAVYDMERIAVRLADDADYDGLTRLVAARLELKHMAGASEVRTEACTQTRSEQPVHAQTHALQAHLTDAPEVEQTHPEQTDADAPAVAPMPRQPRPKRGQNGRTQPRTSGGSVDTDAIKRLHALARANGGTVSVRRAMNELGVGAPAAKRHLRAAGYLDAPETTENGATP